MTDTHQNPSSALSHAEMRLKKRYGAERRFRLYGLAAVALSLLALVILVSSFITTGFSAFWQNSMTLELALEADRIDPKGSRDPSDLRRGDYRGLIRDHLRDLFPDVKARKEVRALTKLVSSGAEAELRDMVVADPDVVGQTIRIDVPLSDDIDMLLKGYIDRNVPQAERRVSDQQIAWLDALAEKGLISASFNTRLFTTGDSREPELAGLAGALVGSLYTMLVTLALSFPIGVAAALYLEEFAPKNRWTDMIEVNINNLAAVPSIVFGLLGLAVFLNFFGMPRSAPLVGGMVLALMTLPTVIIASRAALMAVPPSIREAARGVGASDMQTVFHHVLPLALPGILTGTIIGMSRALGESAPLLMIGMVAFVADIPQSITAPSSALPVQVFIWASSPERAFVEKTAAAIIVLLIFLILMNGVAIYLRRKFERRW